MAGQWTVTLTFLVLCSCPYRVIGQTNNTVDATTRTITFGELEPDKPYKTVGYTADDGGLDPYYALAESFIDSSLPEDLPIGTVKDILDGKASIGDEWQELAKDFVGYALCIVIGILFVFIFPIVGLCFCCCRCCGNCGGKRIQDPNNNTKCKRIGFSIALSILSLFVITGGACTFVTSDQFTDNLNGLNDSVTDAVADLKTFVHNIGTQFDRLGDTNFNFVAKVVEDYVNDTSGQVANDIITAINQAVNLDTRLTELSTFRSEALVDVEQLETDVATLRNQRDTAKTALQNNPASGSLTAEIAYLTNMDAALNTLSAELANYKSKVSTDIFQQMKDDVSQAISNEVNAQTSTLDIAGEFNTIYNDQVKPLLDQFNDLEDSVNNSLSDYQSAVDEFVESVKPYDAYRWYAGTGLAALLTFLAVLMLLGVLLGLMCGSIHDGPTRRGCCSNCGGLLLMSSVGLIFIFGSLLMLLTTLMYMFGALTERYVCQTLDDLGKVEEYTKTLDLSLPVDPSNISVTLNGETVAVSVSNFMEGCRQDNTLYTVLGLEPVVNSTLNKIDDYKSDLNTLNNIDASAAASNAGNSVNLTTAVSDLQDSVTAISDVKTSITAMKSELTTQKGNAETNVPGTGVLYDPMLATLGDMETTATRLESTSQAINNSATSLNNDEWPQAEQKLQDAGFMESLINNVTTNFTNTIFGFLDSYTSDIKAKMQNDVGKCTPFYSITNAVFSEAFCHGIVDPLNGFWLAMGWCLFFFMPSIILSVKLAKHFRTMLYEDDYDISPEPTPLPPYAVKPSAPPAKTSIFPPIHGPNNKVAPF